MKKFLTLLVLLTLLVVSFVAGARYYQHQSSQKSIDSGERRILHYVDPMNPANTSKEPGVAPCGMPMEPVYEDEDILDGSGKLGAVNSTSPGTVKINARKQQLIGVQIDAVANVADTMRIRTLGRIVADENRVYPLIAPTDGWMGRIHESTTGSLVSKNQLMAKIKIYNYDFFTWQERYLIEIGNAAERRRYFLSLGSEKSDRLKSVILDQENETSFNSQFRSPKQKVFNSIRDKSEGGRSPEVYSAPQAKTQPFSSSTPSVLPLEGAHPAGKSKSWRIPRGAQYYGKPSASTVDKEMEIKEQRTGADIEPMAHAQEADSGQHGAAHNKPITTPGKGKKTPEKLSYYARNNMGVTKRPVEQLQYTEKENLTYTSKVRQELLDLGVSDRQLKQLLKTGVYMTDVELRSPVDGLVLSRNVSPQQKIARGTECFRVADLRKVWVEADVYDAEAGYILPGIQAMVSMPKMAQQFPATVSEVLPRYDADGRTLKVRLEMDNPDVTFLPDMFVDVEFHIDLPPAITVPSGAVIDSGKRKTVYVAVEEGVFQPREVVTGRRFNDKVEIIQGLQAGEQIVVSGNFLIDSESRMKFAAARLMDDRPADSSPGRQALSYDIQKVSHVPPNTSLAGKVTDPVCGMKIDPAKAEKEGLTAEVEGQIYYFCSEECAEDFHRHGPQIEESPDEHPPVEAMPKAGGPDMEHMDMSSDDLAVDSGQTARDPVCGMTVDKKDAESADLIVEQGDATHYFCSEECKHEFERDPQHYSTSPAPTEPPKQMDHQP